eukprot:5879318-Prymnesium_polylepis.2
MHHGLLGERQWRMERHELRSAKQTCVARSLLPSRRALASSFAEKDVARPSKIIGRVASLFALSTALADRIWHQGCAWCHLQSQHNRKLHGGVTLLNTKRSARNTKRARVRFRMLAFTSTSARWSRSAPAHCAIMSLTARDE